MFRIYMNIREEGGPLVRLFLGGNNTDRFMPVEESTVFDTASEAMDLLLWARGNAVTVHESKIISFGIEPAYDPPAASQYPEVLVRTRVQCEKWGHDWAEVVEAADDFYERHIRRTK